MDENSQGSKGATRIVADGNVYPNPFFAVIEADHKKLHLCKLIIYVYKKNNDIYTVCRVGQSKLHTGMKALF
jgi:hypothetical protein